MVTQSGRGEYGLVRLVGMRGTSVRGDYIAGIRTADRQALRAVIAEFAAVRADAGDSDRFVRRMVFDAGHEFVEHIDELCGGLVGEARQV